METLVASSNNQCTQATKIGLEHLRFQRELDREAIAEQTARNYLLLLAKQRRNSWLGSKYTIDERKSCPTFQIKLSTFIEHREVNQVCVPHQEGRKETLRGHGKAPEVWEIELGQKRSFQEDEEKHEIPYTTEILTCTICNGRTAVQCIECSETGKHADSVFFLSGGERTPRPIERSMYVHRIHVHEGDRMEEYSDEGIKRVKWSCMHCQGEGQIKCESCDGVGKVKFFEQVTRTHITKVFNEVVTDRGTVPESVREILLDSPFEIVLVQTSFNIEISIPCGFSSKVDAAFSSVIQNQKASLNGGVVRQQILELRSIPVHKIRARTRKLKIDFWVYGTDNVCLCPDYPIPDSVICSIC